MSEHTIEGSGEMVSTPVDWLTRVNTRCIRRVERSRIVSFRVPEPLVDAYLDLPSTSKTTIKVVVMSLIYALAKRYGAAVDCEEHLKHLISEVPAVGGQIIINANIAEAKSTVNVNVDIKALEDAIRLMKYLFDEAVKDKPLSTRRVLEKRLRRAERTIQDLISRMN